MAKDQVQITFKVFNEDFKKAMSEMRESTTRLNREFRLQKEQMKLTGSESDKLKAQVGYLNERYAQAQERVKLTQEQLERAKRVYGENSEEVRKLEADLMNAQIQEQRFANELRLANKELADAESKTLAYGKSLQDAGEKMQDAGKKISSVGSELNKKLTVPIVGAGVASAKLGIDFNKSMGEIATLIPGQSERLQGLKGDIQDVAVITGKSTKDIASGTYDVISAYGDASDTMEKVEINAKAAAAGMASTSDALNLSSAIMKGYGDITAEANKKVMDLSFMTLKLGQTSFPELASSMGKVVPTSKELGISQEELFTVFATGTGVTGNASEVSTQYQGALKALMAPTKEMSKLMEELGVQNGKAMIEQYGLIGSMEKIVEASKESGQPLQSYIGSIQGQVLALALAGEQNDVYKEKLEQLKDSSGAMEEAFREQTEGINATGFTFEQAMVKMQVAGQKMGDAMGPMLAQIADAISRLADRLMELTPEQQQMILKTAGMVAALGPLLKIFGPVVTITGKATSGFGGFLVKVHESGSMVNMLTPLLGGLKTAFTLLTGPIGITIGVVAALTAGGVLLYNNWDTIREKAGVLWGNIQDTFGKIGDKIGSTWDNAKQKTSNAWSAMQQNISNHGGGIRGIISASMSAYQSVWSSGWDAMDKVSGGKLSSMVSNVQSKMTDIRDKIANSGIGKAWNTIWDFELPKIKIPHFSITGKFGLNPPSVPNFNVQWYSEGVIFTRPTLIGVGDAHRGTGRGMEAVLPISKLQTYIREAVPNAGAGMKVEITQNNTYNHSGELSPFELAKTNKRMLQELAMKYSS